MKRLSYQLFSACLLCLTGFSCQQEEVRSETEFTRTVMVYLARESNLSGTSEEKKLAMLQGWDGTGGYLVIYEDVTGQPPCLMEAYRENGENRLAVVQTYEEENSASPEVFGRVIREIKDNYPADSYGLVFFSHASGWLPEHALVTPRSVGQDEEQVMELADFAGVIPDGLFDFILFEACFMAGVEVAYELKDKTRLILASAAELLSSGFKEIYASDMNLLFKKEADLTGFAAKAFDYINTRTGTFRSGTISVIRTAGLDPLAGWLRTVLTEEEPRQQVDGLQPFERYYGLVFDLEDYFGSRVREDEQDHLHQLVEDCLLYRAATPEFMLPYQGFSITTHCGLTSYVPQEKYPGLNKAYKALTWYQTITP